MNAFRHEETPMTPEEAQAVVRRHLEAIPQGDAGPNVADVAEALGVPPEEVARLLDEVRRAPNTATPPRKRTNWGVVVPASIVAVFAMLLVVRATPNAVSPTIVLPSNEILNVSLEGVGERSTDPIPLTSDALLPILTDMTQSGGTATGVLKSATEGEIESDLQAIAAGRWSDAPGMTEREVVVRRFAPSGKFVRWIRLKLPFYDSDDPKVDEAVMRERKRRLEEAIQKQGTPAAP